MSVFFIAEAGGGRSFPVKCLDRPIDTTALIRNQASRCTSLSRGTNHGEIAHELILKSWQTRQSSISEFQVSD
jgi:hypothetical protein